MTAPEPLLLLMQNPLSDSGGRQPAALRVFEDKVEYRQPNLFSHGTTETIRYEQIAQVVVQKGVVWSALAVETNGGGGFRIGGLKKNLADEAKRLIDERIAGLGHPSDDSGGASLPEQLAQLAALRDKGVLDDAEYAAAKARLINTN